MDCSTPGLPVHHQLLEFTQTHAHWVSDAIQPSHHLSSPSPPASNLSQHQGLSSESVLHIRWPKYQSFSFNISPSNEYSGLISFRMDWLSSEVEVMSNSLRPHGLYSPWNSVGQNTGVGSLSLLQGIFPTQGLNSGLPHCRFFTRRATREAQKVHIKAKFHTALDCSPLIQQKTRSFFFGEDKTVSGPEMPGTVQAGETIFKHGSRAHLFAHLHMEFWGSLITIGYMQILKARDWGDLLQENSQRCWPWG